MVFKQVGSDTDNLMNRFGLLGKSLANIKSDFTNGQGWRSFTNIVGKEDLVNFEKFQQELKKGASYHKAFNNNLATSHTYIQKQASDLRRLKTEQNLLNRQYNQGKISQEEYNAALSANKTQMLALTAKTKGLTLAQKAAIVTSKAMGIALKSAFYIGVGLLVDAIISGFSKFVNGQKEAKKEAEELREKTIQNAEAVKEESDKIAELISQYEKYKDIINYTTEDKTELKSIQDEFIESLGSEADALNLVNGKYEENIKKIRELATEKLKQNENTLITNRQYAQDDFENNVKNGFLVRDEETKTKNDDALMNQLMTVYQEIGEEIDGFNLAIDPIAAHDMLQDVLRLNLDEGLSAEEKVKALTEAIEIFKERNLTDTKTFERLVNLQKGYQNQVDAYVNATNDLADNMLSRYSLENGTPDGLSEKEFSDWLNGLLETVQDGDDDLRDAIKSMAITEYGGSFEQSDIFDVTTATRAIDDALSEYKDKVSDFLSEKEKIEAAAKEQIENGSISSKTASELLDLNYGSAIEYDKETKSYKLLGSELENIIGLREKEAKAKLESEKTDLTSKTNAERERLTKLRDSIKDSVGQKYYQDKIDNLNKQFEEAVKTIDSNLGLIDSSISTVSDDIFDSTSKLDEYTESIKKLSDSVNVAQTAMKEQTENGKLSADTINSLSEAGLSAAMSYNEQTGETYLLVDALKELTQEQINNERNNLNQTISETTSKVKELKEQYDKLSKSINSANDVKLLKSIKDQINSGEGLLSSLQDKIAQTDSLELSSVSDSSDEYLKSVRAAFEKERDNLDYSHDMDLISDEEYYNSLSALNERYFKDKADFLDDYRKYEVEVYKGLKQLREKDSKSESSEAAKDAFEQKKADLDYSHDMDLITDEEYYNTLRDLNEEYFKDKTDLLDEYRKYEVEVYKGLKQIQIDAIQKQIDALKSVNEEKQQEIDLEKAKIALENAKKQKSLAVYDSERGWIRETDRSAIDSAQKEYDDLVLDKKINALENLIESIEKGTAISNTAENNNVADVVKAADNIKQNIENSKVEPKLEVSDAKNPVYTPIDRNDTVFWLLKNYFNVKMDDDKLRAGIKKFQNAVLGDSNATTRRIYENGVSATEKRALQNVTNNSQNIAISNVNVTANNPQEFVSQMEQIAAKKFDDKFPKAMDDFGRGLKLYRMNHR